MSLSLTPEDEALVLNAPLFTGIGTETVLWLVSSARQTTFPDGGLLFSQGDRVFLVFDGHVNLFALTETGAQTIIEVMERGQIFAEATMFMNARFPVNAELAPGSRLLIIPADSFLSRLGERPELATQVFASLVRWQRRLIREIAALKGRSPAQRVGMFLLAHARSSSETVQLPLTMVEFASRIGITPESLSRVMARLRPLGVTSSRSAIVLGDPDALRRFCQVEE